MYTRITSKMMMTNFKSQLNYSMSDLSSKALAVQNKRKYQNDYEDPTSATRAYQYRREMERTEDYMENTKTVDSMITSRETVVMDVSAQAITLNKQVLGSITGTSSPESRMAYAQQLRATQEALVQSLNTSYGGSFLFGGTSTDKVPFELQEDGTVTFRSVPVSGLTQSQLKEFNDESTPDVRKAELEAVKQANLARLAEFNDEKQYADLGFGLEVDGNDTVNPNSAFNMISNGISFLGSGIDKNGNSMNFLQLIGDLADAVTVDGGIDLDYIKQLTDNYRVCMKDITMELTQMGSDMNFMDTNMDRLERNELNLNEKINDTEYIPEAEAITAFEEAQYAYKASLQIGSQILTQSFLDYMR